MLARHSLSKPLKRRHIGKKGFLANQFLILKTKQDGLFVAACAGFGKVLKVLDKRTQKHYAMKLQPKDS